MELFQCFHFDVGRHLCSKDQTTLPDNVIISCYGRMLQISDIPLFITLPRLELDSPYQSAYNTFWPPQLLSFISECQ